MSEASDTHCGLQRSEVSASACNLIATQEWHDASCPTGFLPSAAFGTSACARMTTRYKHDKNPSLIPINCVTIRACSRLRQSISHSLEAEQSCRVALAQA